MIRDETKQRGRAGPLAVRLPHDIRQWLKNVAARNYRSQSSEVIHMLKELMDAEQPKKTAQPGKASG